MKLFHRTKHILLLYLSKVALLIGSFAIMNSCRVFFHEEELPTLLKTKHPFIHDEF